NRGQTDRLLRARRDRSFATLDLGAGDVPPRPDHPGRRPELRRALFPLLPAGERRGGDPRRSGGDRPRRREVRRHAGGGVAARRLGFAVSGEERPGLRLRRRPREPARAAARRRPREDGAAPPPGAVRAMRSLPYLWCGLVLALAFLLSLCLGAVAIPPLDIARMAVSRLVSIPRTWDPTSEIILFDLRLPRAAMFALTGAALGGSGAAYQGLFRNPLADPFLIGVAPGAGLGAVAAMTIHWPYTFWGLMVIPMA